MLKIPKNVKLLNCYAIDDAVEEVGGEGIAGMEIVDGADGFAVLGEEAVAHTIDPFGIAGGKSLAEQFNTMLADEDLPFGGSFEPC